MPSEYYVMYIDSHWTALLSSPTPDIFKCIMYKIKGLIEDAEGGLPGYKKQKTIAVSNGRDHGYEESIEGPAD